MTINVQIHDCSARIAISGHFEFKVHRDFRKAYISLIDNTAIREIEIEMSMVDYLDSSALGMLVLLNERAKAVHKSVALLNTFGKALQVLEIANFNKIFNFKSAV